MSIAADQLPARHAGMRRPSPPHLALIAVAAGYCLLVFLRTSQSLPLTYDEVVYASQVSVDTPAAGWGPQRAWGMSLLLAPVVAITEWVPAMRVYLTLLAGVLMYAAFRPWLRLFPGRYRYGPAVAAGCFGTLWVSVLYGTMAYPNVWTAFALVAGVGCFLRAVTDPAPAWWQVAATASWFAAASLLRPTDSLVAAGPLLLAGLLLPAWRRWPRPPAAPEHVWRPLLAVAAGLAVGWGQWVAEAYARFDGPVARLRDGGEATGSALRNAVTPHLHALDGPQLLCRPANLCAGVDPLAVGWWVALPVLVAAGLIVARGRWLAIGAVATAAGVAVALPYLVLFDFAAPRFLLPSYGLLAIPVAGGLVWLATAPPARLRAVTVTALVAGLGLHLAVQQDVLGRVRESLEQSGRGQAALAEFLRAEHGVRPPCLLWGRSAIQLSYQLDCRSMDPQRDVPSATDTALAEAAARGEAAVVVRVRTEEQDNLPAFMAGWRRVALPGSDDYVGYLPPGR